MSSTSSPRAATSVATSVRILPASNRASALSRCACALSPWIATASMSWRRSFSTSRSAPAFVRDEDEREPFVARQQVDQRLQLVLGGHRDELVVDLARAPLLRQVGLEASGEVRVAARQLADLAVERRGEEHRLALRRQHAHDPVDLRLEAHVEHPVGLVEHEHRDARRSSISCRSARSCRRPGVATSTCASRAALAWARSGTPP